MYKTRLENPYWFFDDKNEDFGVDNKGFQKRNSNGIEGNLNGDNNVCFYW